MADSGSCQPDLHSKELCADPLDRQMGNEEPRLQLGDWKAAYCRLKEEGDDEIIGEDEREREWCWQVSVLHIVIRHHANLMLIRMMENIIAIPQHNYRPRAARFCSTLHTGN